MPIRRRVIKSITSQCMVEHADSLAQLRALISVSRLLHTTLKPVLNLFKNAMMALELRRMSQRSLRSAIRIIHSHCHELIRTTSKDNKYANFPCPSSCDSTCSSLNSDWTNDAKLMLTLKVRVEPGPRTSITKLMFPAPSGTPTTGSPAVPAIRQRPRPPRPRLPLLRRCLP